MIGEKAYQNAMKRRAELRQELDEIETFLRLCERFADLSRRSAAPEPGEREPDLVLRDRETGEQTVMEAKAVVGMDLLPHVRKMALDLGRPVSRGDVKRNLSTYGLRLNAKDEATYIGTVLWRAKDQFVHLKPHGYWPRDVAYAPAGYDPAAQKDADSDEGGDHRENGSAAACDSSATAAM